MGSFLKNLSGECQNSTPWAAKQMTKLPLQISPKRSHQTHVSHYKLQRTSITRMRQLVNNHRFANNYCELKMKRVRKQHSTPCTCDSKSSTKTNLVSSKDDEELESNSTCDCPTTANHMQTDPWHGLLPLKPVELTLEEIIECCAKPQSEKDSTRKNCVHSHRKTSKKP